MRVWMLAAADPRFDNVLLDVVRWMQRCIL